jgi:membrane associated rhomboid family serine protease
VSRLYEAGQALARHLVVEKAYIPLEQALPGLAGISGGLDVALAAFEGPDLRVQALILDEGSGDPGFQLEALRLGLQSQEERIPGRIKAYVWILTESDARARELRKDLEGLQDGHFLAKTLVGRGVLSLESEKPWSAGRLASQPGAEELARHLDPGAAPDETRARSILSQRQADERQARRLLQGAATPVTWALIALNVAVFLWQNTLAAQLHGQGLSDAAAWQEALMRLGGNDPALSLGKGQWWRWMAACFLHGGILHIAMNMASLFSLGALAERLCGPRRFLGLYLFCGLVASILSALCGKAGIPSVGASGAIVGLAGALMAPQFRRDPRFPKDLSGRLFSWLARPIGFLFVLGFGLQFLDLPVQFDNFAHLGGLLCGFGVAYIYPPFLIRKTDRTV